MFVTKRKIRKVVLAAINAHSRVQLPDTATTEQRRDTFMYQCGEMNMAFHILKELKVPSRCIKGGTDGESNSKRNKPY